MKAPFLLFVVVVICVYRCCWCVGDTKLSRHILYTSQFIRSCNLIDLGINNNNRDQNGVCVCWHRNTEITMRKWFFFFYLLLLAHCDDDHTIWHQKTLWLTSLFCCRPVCDDDSCSAVDHLIPITPCHRHAFLCGRPAAVFQSTSSNNKRFRRQRHSIRFSEISMEITGNFWHFVVLKYNVCFVTT